LPHSNRVFQRQKHQVKPSFLTFGLRQKQTLISKSKPM
jgi:hypothetical protein